jgi:DNA polymerase bacteriophage-type
MRLTIDLETRSRADLKKVGMYKYAEDPSTDVLCVGVKVDDQPTKVYTREHLKMGPACTEIGDLIASASEIHAHNAGFERAVWHHVLHKRNLMRDLPLEKMHCTAARAAAMSLPRALGQVCEVLGLSMQKDKAGNAVMLRLCKPNKKGEWEGTDAEFEILYRYCAQDVEAEYALSCALPELSAGERAVWLADQRTNDRGVRICLSEVRELRARLLGYEQALLLEVQKLTKGRLNSVRQVTEMCKWLAEECSVEIPDLTKGTVAKALAEKNLPDHVRRVLEIRQSLGKSSLAKLETMEDWAQNDERVRGMLMYHGAGTGRWTGKGPQPHNFPRGSVASEDQEPAIKALCSWSMPEITAVYGDPFDVAASCLRGLIIPADGHRFIVSDFSQIEARVLAWVAGEAHVLEAFASGKDLYKVAASAIYSVDYSEVTKQQRQIGKVAVLALGYQGGKNAFRKMAETVGLEIEEDLAQEIVNKWREKHGNIVSFWARLDHCISGVVSTGKVAACGCIKAGIRGRFLHLRLPSGRLLAYADPRIEDGVTPWGSPCRRVTFAGVESGAGYWVRHTGYGGLWTENIVQAIARDLLAEAMLRAETIGYTVALTVHDEIVAEVPFGKGSLEGLNKLMTSLPEWAAGCPVEADGYEARRYRK